jgi:hypothetical protein
VPSLDGRIPSKHFVESATLTFLLQRMATASAWELSSEARSGQGNDEDFDWQYWGNDIT